MTRHEKRKVLSKWLGYFVKIGDDARFRMYRPDGSYVSGSDTFSEDFTWDYVPDFFTSEEASALLLEKMRRPLFVSDWPGCEGWRVDIGVKELTKCDLFPNHVGGPLLGPTHADRKTAIAEAALKIAAEDKQK